MLTENGKEGKAVKREFSAGGAVFRRVPPFDFAQGKRVARVPRGLDIEWLLIRQKGSKNWRLPKGNIEKGESSRTAAVREVWEETGIKAKPIEKLDAVRYFYVLKGARIFKTVAFFLMECAGGAPKIDRRWQHEIEEVKWTGTKEALGCLAFPSEKRVLKKAAGALNLESGI